MIILIVASCVLSFILSVIMARITKKIVSGMRSELFSRLLRLPVSYISKTLILLQMPIDIKFANSNIELN